MDLQRAHIEKNGGLSNIQSLKSLVIHGEILDKSSESLPFKLFRKRPNFYRMQIERPGLTILSAHNGTKTQRKVELANGEERLVELTAAEIEAIEQSSRFDGAFFELRGRPEWLQLVGVTEVDGMLAYELEVSPEADSHYETIWLHAEHYQEVKLRKRAIEGSGAEGVESTDEIYFSDFDQVRGVWFSRNVVQMSAGARVLTIQIDRVRPNVGLFDSFFEKL